MEPVPAAKPELDTDFDENDRLFHYTTSDGLAGILESDCLWATHFLALNDRQEFRTARDALVSFVARRMGERLAALKVNHKIKPLPDAPSVMEVARTEGARFVDSLYHAMLNVHQPFVFSGFVCNKREKYAFENGVLQHWGTYGGGGGFAIQINPHTLAECLRKNEEKFLGDVWSTGKVDYTEGLEPPILLRPFYEELGKKAQETIKQSIFPTEDNIKIADIISPFIKITGYSKHHFFKIEQEARIVIMRLAQLVDTTTPHNVHVRAVNHDLVSYVRVLDGALLGTPCSIDRIIVGPGGDRNRRCEAIREFLRMRRIDIEVAVSEIPYLPH